ncbi:MAG TPA: glycosyltransferase [Kaistia sp.]|nr:glycosyltransferase [Kaistia sp.]
MSASELLTIVTPTLNSEDFLDETIASVVTQAGDFSIRYHVQDGGSKDGTLAIIEAWQARLASGALPVRCRGIAFSFTVSKDGGMYQAINRAFAAAREGGADTPSVMGWINSDDRLAPGAFATIRALMTDLPEIEFITSRVSLINDRGATLGVESPIAFERAKLVAGDYDGRSGAFVMQEGTFWTAALWDKAGGLDEGFRLAGDWDLWRRLARHAPLTTVDTLLGFHRRRPGQLSESMDRYYGEIDRLPPEKAPGATPLPPENGARRQKRSVAQYSPEQKAWRFVPDFGSPLLAPMIHAGGVAFPTVPLEVLAGASAPIGAHPELHLPAGVIWMNQPLMLLSSKVPVAGRYTLVIECRNWQQNNRLTIRSAGETVFEEAIEVSGHRRNIVLRIPVALPKGHVYFEVESDRRPKDPREHFLLVAGMHLELSAEPKADTLPAVREEDLAEAAAATLGRSGWGGLGRFLGDGSGSPVGRPGEGGLYGAMAALEAEIEADRAKASRLRDQLRSARAEINLLRLKDAAIHR